MTAGKEHFLKRIADAGAIALMVSLTWFNSQPEAAGLIPAPWDKLAHGGIFGALSAALAAACWPRLWPVAAVVVPFAAFDELRQLHLPGRSADWGDFLTDLAAMAVVLSCSVLLRIRRSVKPVAGGRRGRRL